MALLSAMQVSYDQNENLEDQEIGFLAYGSGSKAKVFAGKVGKSWREVVQKWNVFENLKNRKAIDFETYEILYRYLLESSVNPNYKGFGLKSIETENPLSLGARFYHYQ